MDLVCLRRTVAAREAPAVSAHRQDLCFLVLVTITLPFLRKVKASVARAPKDSACLSWKRLRNIPDAEPQSVSRGLVSM
ncbi:MAG: hypothetical protein DMF00_08350 [Verrucomicrobia bacterium]|nr:MAG: hypothetical protein DMF00_08350 [Verrucomicrobiota bacterium]